MPRLVVRVGECLVHAPPALLVTIGLGSCVAVVLHDTRTGIGGLAHVLLPVPAAGKPARPEGRYAVSAIPALLREMATLGASRPTISGRLVGGASMFANLVAPGTIQIGTRNVVATTEALAIEGIPLVGAATGGDFGRSVELLLPEGTVRITSYAHDPESL